jgi:uncharacterized Fe-S cluster protein YjdI
MDDNEVSREMHYTNGEITVVWKPNLCQGSTFCWRGLPEVFRHNQRPWIVTDGAETQRIVDQVAKCPSGALSIIYNKDN